MSEDTFNFVAWMFIVIILLGVGFGKAESETDLETKKRYEIVGWVGVGLGSLVVLATMWLNLR